VPYPDLPSLGLTACLPPLYEGSYQDPCGAGSGNSCNTTLGATGDWKNCPGGEVSVQSTSCEENGGVCCVPPLATDPCASRSGCFDADEYSGLCGSGETMVPSAACNSLDQYSACCVPISDLPSLGITGGSTSGGSSTSGSSSSSSSSGSGSSGSGSSGGSSSSSSGGTSGGTAAACGGLPYYGTINLFNQPVNGNYDFSGGVALGPCGGGGSPACQPGVTATCCFTPATTGASGGGSTGGTSSGGSTGGFAGEPSAGAISLDDGTTNIATFTIDASVGAYYDLWNYPNGIDVGNAQEVTTLSWSAGDTLSLSSPGATIDAISGSAVAPTVPSLSPSISSGVALSQSSGQTFTFTGPVPAGQFNSYAITLQNSAGSLVCGVTPSANAGTWTLTIPGSSASAPYGSLGSFPSGSTGTLTLGSTALSNLTCANAQIGFMISAPVQLSSFTLGP